MEPFNAAIVAASSTEYNAICQDLAGLPCTLAHVPLTSTAGLLDASPPYDVCVISLPPNPLADKETSRLHVPIEGLPSLFVMSVPTPEDRQWAIGKGAKDVMVRSATANELRYRIERIVSMGRRTLQRAAQESTLLQVLKHLIDNQIEVVEPVPEPLATWGHVYPDVEPITGASLAARECLETMATEGLLARSLANRIRICPACTGHFLNFRETCPKCSSADIVPSEVIHHFVCANIGTLESFRQGSKLVCPKCRDTLRQIGRDYDKPAHHWACGECSFIFGDPKVEAQCLQCSHTCAPEATLLQLIYRYRLTPLAAQALAEGRIGGASLAGLLRNRYTGLHTRQYFEHELQREIARSARYSASMSLMFVRIVGLDQVRLKHSARVSEYANSIFGAINTGLRGLDTTCVWNDNTVGVLLPGTAEAGANVVAERMHRQVVQLDYLRSIQEPDISVSIVSNDQKFESSQEMIDAALHDLQ